MSRTTIAADPTAESYYDRLGLSRDAPNPETRLDAYKSTPTDAELNSTESDNADAEPPVSSTASEDASTDVSLY